MAQRLKRDDRCRLFLKGNVVINAKDLSVLSPQLLSKGADALFKSGDVDDAGKMFQRLMDLHATEFGNAASVGLGSVALARKKPEEALKLFNEVLANNPASLETIEATLGKLQALLETSKLDEAMKLGLQSAEDKSFQGESTARIYLILGNVCEKKAGASAGDEAKAFLDQALGYYQRVRAAYASYPELCAEAARRIVEVKKKL